MDRICDQLERIERAVDIIQRQNDLLLRQNDQLRDKVAAIEAQVARLVTALLPKATDLAIVIGQVPPVVRPNPPEGK